ncbi:MAG: glycosyltransferase family 2 protein [Candidatus Pacearchaeota archaeon]
MKKFPLVCIVVVNWNGGEMVEKCIKSLKMTSYPNYKLIFVDNNSEDGSLQKVMKIKPDAKVLRLDKNYGYAPGMNVGMKYAIDKMKANYICAMSSDVITVQKDWLDLQIKELEEKKEYGVSAGKLVFPDGRFQEMVRKDRSNYKEMDRGQYDFIKEVDAVWGACIIYKTVVLKKIGFLDENFFYGPDDIDMCIRARKAGFKIIYNGLAKIIHIGAFSGLSPKRDYIYRYQSEGMLIYAFRHLSITNKILMVFRQLIRALVTRKDPFSNFSVKNTIWHWKSLPKRIILFFIAFFAALKNFKKIKYNADKIKYEELR